MRSLVIISRLAWRNLWRNHRRTAIMLAAISIGIWAMIFMTALMRGMVNQMVYDAVRVLPGHVQIHQDSYLDDPNVVNSIVLGDELQDLLEEESISAWSERVRVPAVISSAHDVRSITLVGINPERERNVSFVAEDVSEGAFLADAADDGLVIGRKLSETLESGLGKRIVIMTQDPDNEIVDRGFRIIGIFDASTESVEETFVFTGLEVTQELLRIGERVHEVAVVGDSFRDAEQFAVQLAERAVPGQSVLSWDQLDRYLGSMLGVMDGFVLVWVVVVFLALSFGLVNTLVMAVFERVREIGLMLALGMRPVMILGQVMMESILLISIGLAIGNILAWVTILPLRDGIDLSVVGEGMEMFGSASVLYPQLDLKDMALANIIVVVLGILASLSPALRASRYQPVEALTKT